MATSISELTAKVSKFPSKLSASFIVVISIHLMPTIECSKPLQVDQILATARVCELSREIIDLVLALRQTDNQQMQRVLDEERNKNAHLLTENTILQQNVGKLNEQHLQLQIQHAMLQQSVGATIMAGTDLAVATTSTEVKTEIKTEVKHGDIDGVNAPPTMQIAVEDGALANVTTTDEQVPNDDDHDRNSKVPCPVCHLMLTRKHFKTHARIHTGEQPYECCKCKQHFRYSYQLVNHKKVHNLRRRWYRIRMTIWRAWVLQMPLYRNDFFFVNSL